MPSVHCCHRPSWNYISRNDETMTSILPGLVQVYKALGHPARIRIMAMLRTGELCACQITAVLDLAPSTISAHLAELRRAGLIAERKDGRWVHYRPAESEDVVEIAEWMWQRVRRDPQVRSDAAVVRQLRKVPVAELCSAHLNLDQLAISQAGRA